MVRDTKPGEVLVPIPQFGCRDYVRRAVESVLEQSHENVKVVVLNDADPDTPWSNLEDIEDPRLWRIDLDVNVGYYFAVSAAWRACNSEFLLVQDADDWSESGRISALLKTLDDQGGGYALSGQWIHYENDRHPVTGSPMQRHVEDYSDIVSQPASREFKQYGQHHGLLRSDFVERIGGHYGGFRVSYDLLVMALAHYLGELRYCSDVLYNRYRRQNSLTTAPATADDSPYRDGIEDKLRKIYASVVEGDADLSGLNIRKLTGQFMSEEEKLRLEVCAEDLALAVSEPTTRIRKISIR